MTAVSVAVLTIFTASVIGLGLMLLARSEDRPDERGGDEDGDDGDGAWIAELRALNEAMPRVRKHRARVAARTGRHGRDSR